MPELAMSIYSFDPDIWYYDWDYDYEDDSSRKTNYVAALNLNLGKQWVFNDQFLIDYYFGLGYGFGKNNDYRSYHFGFMGAEEDSSITFTMGFKIGLLLK